MQKSIYQQLKDASLDIQKQEPDIWEDIKFNSMIGERMSKINQRGFMPVNNKKAQKNIDGEIVYYLPERGTKYSAGYDFKSTFSFVILPDSPVKIFTNIKAYMLEDEYLDIYIRSSIGMKKNLRLVNCVGIVDSDYYENPQNDGNIIIALKNEGKEDQFIELGEKIAQGIFKKYLITDDDNPNNKIRTGGIGSTGK